MISKRIFFTEIIQKFYSFDAHLKATVTKSSNFGNEIDHFYIIMNGLNVIKNVYPKVFKNCLRW